MIIIGVAWLIFRPFTHQEFGQFGQFWPDLTACRERLNCNKYASLRRGGQYFYNDIPAVWLININEAHFLEDEGADKQFSVGQSESDFKVVFSYTMSSQRFIG